MYRATFVKKMKFRLWGHTASRLVASTQNREVDIEKKIISEFVDINYMAGLAVVFELLACDYVELTLF